MINTSVLYIFNVTDQNIFILIRFEHKEFILLFAGIGILLLLFIFLLQWKKKVAKRVGDKKWVQLLTATYSQKLFIAKFLLVILALAVGIIAVMNPRRAGESNAGKREGIDIAIALDVSKSMLAEDLAPNRLERARQFISKLMNEMPDDRIALVLFAGKAYLQMPLTADHGAAQLYVSSASPDAIPQQGTVISDALTMSTKAFTGTEQRFKAIVLISDGEDHDEDAINTAKTLSEQGVMINAVGIGSPEGTTIPDLATGDVKKDEAGNTVISRLNEEILQQVAQETNGVYIKLESSDAAVQTIKKQLSQIDPKTFTDISQVNFTSYFIWFAAIMFLLLFAENFIPETRKPVTA